MRNYVICQRFSWEKHVNLITRMVKMEIVWRQCGVNLESDTLYGDFYVKISLEIVWGFHEENMVNRNTLSPS